MDAKNKFAATGKPSRYGRIENPEAPSPDHDHVTFQRFQWGEALLGLLSLAAVLLLVLLSFTCMSASAAPEDWHLTLYQGSVSGDSLGDLMEFTADFNDSSNFTAIALSRNLSPGAKHLQWEWEAQVVKHYGKQDHMEFNGLIKARWMTFPWDRYLDTNFTIGDGISIATRVPRIESAGHDDTSAILNYLLFELEFPLHNHPNWSVVARLHHRSGVFGLFDGVRGASNAVGIGLRHTF